MLRNEKKYLVPNRLLNPIRNRVNTFMRPDIFVRDNPEGLPQYTVRSIYFDSRRLEAYHEKLGGVLFRRKFRVRGYHGPEPEEQVVLEIKRKIGSKVKKYRAFVNYTHLDELLENGQVDQYVENTDYEPNACEDAGRFLFHLKKKQFVPTCLITYDREAYHGLLDSGVRITFDKNLRSRMWPPTGQLFSEEQLKKFFPNHFILEIKYFSEEMPRWARSLIQEFRLRNEALSKYTLGIDAHLGKGSPSTNY
ncbi:MAG: polyphosphate polymerase domain-containing protein [Bacteroidales bacterium]|nr:polyphosphate polymerase domain-containing protein [Bacteroidales bacterium]